MYSRWFDDKRYLFYDNRTGGNLMKNDQHNEINIYDNVRGEYWYGINYM